MALAHESAEVRTRRVMAFAYGFVAFVVVLGVLVGVLYRTVISDNKVAAQFRPFPGPRLQPNPSEDYALFHREQTDQLTGVHWVDRGHGLVHVPIERAMSFVAAKGNAAYDPVGPATEQKLPPTPQDGQQRASPSPVVAPYGQGKQPMTLRK